MGVVTNFKKNFTYKDNFADVINLVKKIENSFKRPSFPQSFCKTIYQNEKDLCGFKDQLMFP